MRSYTSTLLFEDAIDLLPYGSATWRSVHSIFTPTVHIVEDDCETLLGEKREASLDILGCVELNGATVTRARLIDASEAGQTYFYLKSISTCISSGGICKACYRASTGLTVSTGTYVSIRSEFIIQVENISVAVGDSSCTLQFSPTSYSSLQVFVNSVRLNDLQYSVAGTSLNLTTPVGVESEGSPGYGTVTVKYVVDTKTPYVYWLASTFSGSLLGMSPLPARLPVIPLKLHATLLPYGDVASLTSNVVQSSLTPAPILSYLSKISDPMEKAVLVALLNCIYLPQAEVADAPVAPPS